MRPTATGVEIRPARPDDRPGIIELLTVTQHWVADDRFDRFYAWKHEASPFGASASWVAIADGRVVGFRPFLRWEFDHPDGRIRRAVRAVDASTHPDYQRRGIFTQLTQQALSELRAAGVDFVFNTPNDKSLAGELKLGWAEVGRLPTSVRPTGIGAGFRMLSSRVPAGRWSARTEAGVDARKLLADRRVDQLLAMQAPPVGLRTRRTADYLRWRYGFEDLAYRAIAHAGDPTRGLVVFRLRPRGRALEAALCDLLVPTGAVAAAQSLEREVIRRSGADYVIQLDGRRVSRTGFVRLPRQGPLLVWRALASGEMRPKPENLQLRLGDIELF